MENKFGVLKATLASIGTLLHCMLVTIKHQSPINLVCLDMSVVCESSRVAKRKRYGKLACIALID